jgi:hypothetical protein
MSRQAPKVYEITALGPQGEVTAQRYLPYPLPEEFDGTLIDRSDEREIHFQTLQRALGASGYEARLMQPREVKKLIRHTERQIRSDAVMQKAADLIGLRKYIELLPVIAEFDRPEHKLSANFARS